MSSPRLSVIVRSYNRLAALDELLTALRAQDHDDFEVVVVEQSTQRPPAEAAVIDAHAADPRVRVVRFPPLGGPRARNTGVRLARGALLVFIDDDDLPAGPGWLRAHEANFTDPRCLGVTGQFVGEDGQPQPYRNQARARARVLSFNLLRWQRVYARTDVRRHVESLMGGNAAIPRTTLARFGLWDECTPIEDEPSLAYRIGAGKQPEEYLLFDPTPQMIRRLEVPGGMAKRSLSGLGYGKKVFTFLHNIVGHYYPARFVLLYPAYYVFLAYHVIEWIVSDSKRHPRVLDKVLGTLGFTLALPLAWTGWLARWAWGRLRHGAPPHRPTLDDPNPAELPA
ncbi:MAG: glycosyltransferase family 2 protein [Kofleriaceae bacterium]